jgi:hypothetical protein
MTFKPRLWRPIAMVLSVLNVGGAAFAIAAAEPWHAATRPSSGSPRKANNPPALADSRGSGQKVRRGATASPCSPTAPADAR